MIIEWLLPPIGNIHLTFVLFFLMWLIEGNYENLTLDRVKEIVQEGGTILGSSRTNPRKEEKGFERIFETLKILDIYMIL